MALEGFALTTFEEIRELAEQTGEEMVAHCHDYNMADEVTHVALGDYWLEKLSEEQPWRKERAKAAQQEFERSWRWCGRWRGRTWVRACRRPKRPRNGARPYAPDG